MKKSALILILALSILLPVGFVSAVTTVQYSGSGSTPQYGGNNANPQQIHTLDNPLKVNSLTELLTTIADFLIFIGMILAVFMFIFIGFKFVWAQGSGEKISEARQWFFYAVIGTAILISSKVIVQVVKSTFESAGIVNPGTFDQH